MNILRKPVSEFSFGEVVEFCKEAHGEGVQVDYKMDFPSNGFAKHFAAFSNTRGGIIIVGVEEDKKSGVPVSWVGITKDAKQIERIHQAASNVEPIPSYEVHATDEVEGKCFVLIRINEGDKTPYYVQNDSNIWVRTGNISNPIGIASPDGLELLFGKREKAEKARSLYLKISDNAYRAGLEREEKERQRLIQVAKEKGENVGNYYQQSLGTGVAMCTVVIQPYFPHKAIASPRDIKASLNELRSRCGGREFPDLNFGEPIPEGLFRFMHGYSGYIECQQVFGCGLVRNDLDVLQVDQNERRIVRIGFVIGTILKLLQFTNALYNKFGYQGVLNGYISLNGMKDVYTSVLKPSGWHFFGEDKKSLFDDYQWDLLLDTNILKDQEHFKIYCYSLIKEIYWSLGYEEVNEKIIDAFLEQNGLSF